MLLLHFSLLWAHTSFIYFEVLSDFVFYFVLQVAFFFFSLCCNYFWVQFEFEGRITMYLPKGLPVWKSVNCPFVFPFLVWCLCTLFHLLPPAIQSPFPSLVNIISYYDIACFLDGLIFLSLNIKCLELGWNAPYFFPLRLMKLFVFYYLTSLQLRARFLWTQ